ncbi:MAG: hypothetical protein AAGL49_03610, partial [Pseudomonadota bacterium]
MSLTREEIIDNKDFYVLSGLATTEDELGRYLFDAPEYVYATSNNGDLETDFGDESASRIIYYGQSWDDTYANQIRDDGTRIVGYFFINDADLIDDGITNRGSGYKSIIPERNLDTDDVLVFDNEAEWAVMFGGLGDDILINAMSIEFPSTVSFNTMAGGSGNDIVSGSSEADILYGDQTDYSGSPLFGPSFGENLFGEPGDDLILGFGGDDSIFGNDGDDLLDGGNGDDTLDGGAGNDQLHGGVRGREDTDRLTGGEGNDIFWLAYGSETDAEAQGNFWGDYHQTLASSSVSGAIKDAAKQAIKDGFKSIGSDLLSNVGGGFVLGAVASGLGSVAATGIQAAFLSAEAGEVPEDDTDVVKVLDFHPTYDTLAIPIAASDTIEIQINTVASSDGQTFGISFLAGSGSNKFTYAEVTIDPDYWAQFGLNGTEASAQNLLENVRLNGIVLADDDPDKGIVYPYDVFESLDGVTATNPFSDETLGLLTSPGTATAVYGAFGPLSAIDTAQGGNYVGGTNFADIINVNGASFDPTLWDTTGADLTSLEASVFGFDGDDLLIGGSADDNLHGGAGNDDLLGFSSITEQNRLHGGEGIDVLYAGGGNSVLNGGVYDVETQTYSEDSDGDYASFIYARGSVTASLANQDVDNLSGSLNSSNFDAVEVHDGNTYYYLFHDIQHLVGSENDDDLTGDDQDNIIQGRGGIDFLDGGAGFDIVSYSDVGLDDDGNVLNPDADGTSGLIIVDYFASGGQFDTTETDWFVDTQIGFEGVEGTLYDDDIDLGSSNSSHVVLGIDGNDILTTGNGADTIEGGDGDDTIDGGDGRDSIDGGSGEDVIDGGGGSDVIDGGTRADDIDGGSGSDEIYGGNGADTILGNSGNDTIYGEGTGDLIDGGGGADFIDGGRGKATGIRADGRARWLGGTGLIGERWVHRTPSRSRSSH